MLAAASELSGDKLERLALRLNRIDASSVSFEQLERLLERGDAGTLAIPAPPEQRQENRTQEYQRADHQDDSKPEQNRRDQRG